MNGLGIRTEGSPVTTTRSALSLALGLSLLATPVSASGDHNDDETPEVSRSIIVTLTDTLRYDPSIVFVEEGETVEFVLLNPTAAAHDFTIGDIKTQIKHELEMAAGMSHDEDAEMPDGSSHEDGSNAVAIPAGETRNLTVTFDEVGSVVMGCHVPGHWAAGMAGATLVLPAD